MREELEKLRRDMELDRQNAIQKLKDEHAKEIE